MGFNSRFCQCFGGSLATLALAVSPALADEVHDWAFDAATSELTFALSDEVFPQFFLLAEPPRLVLDIPDTEIGTIEPEQIYNGAVQTIRVAQYTPDQVRVVIELTPDIVLAPDQADIQFDDDDGLRRWRFRPLIAGDNAAVAVAPGTPTPAPSSNHEVSLSAANLQIYDQQSASTALPIDPYDAEVASTVVSVPPLAEDLTSEAAASTVVSVPPLEALPVDPAVATAAIATAPDLPPMTVPELEQPGVDHTASAHSETPAVAAVPANNRSSLPNISPRVPSEIPAAAERAPLPERPEPDSTALEMSDPRGASAEMTLEEEEIAPVEVIPALDEEPPVAEVTPVTDVTPVAVVPPSVPVPSTIAEPITEAEQPVTEPVTVAEQSLSNTTGLAPVELSLIETPGADDNLEPSLDTIQQPAARRTITQTQQPAPLTFGQPLPNTTN